MTKELPSKSRFPQDPQKLEELIKYSFKDIHLLEEALTHRSFVNEQPFSKQKDNERLEFLGDAVLNLSLSDLIWQRFPHLPEGRLSKIRAGQVNEKTLAGVARRLHLGSFLRMGKGEEKTGGRNKASLLADTLEALLGAVYLDGGFEAARSLVHQLFSENAFLEALGPDRDYKTLLQELCQGKMKSTPTYRVVREEGPDHCKTFFIELSVGGQVLSLGKGSSKKEAEQEAAEQALLLLRKKEEAEMPRPPSANPPEEPFFPAEVNADDPDNTAPGEAAGHSPCDRPRNGCKEDGNR